MSMSCLSAPRGFSITSRNTDQHKHKHKHVHVFYSREKNNCRLCFSADAAADVKLSNGAAAIAANVKVLKNCCQVAKTNNFRS